MKQHNLFFDPERLFEELCTIEQLRAGFKAVRRNKGSAGIDGVSIEDFDANLEEELGRLQQELASWA